MGTIRKPEHRLLCKSCNKEKTAKEISCNNWTFECEDCRVITKNIYKYNITREESEKLYSNTNCKICNAEFTKIGGKRRVIDHCHSTGRVRGAICRNCNTGLGMFSDSSDLIKIALEYLNNN